MSETNFFEFRKRVTRQKTATQSDAKHTMTVSQLTGAIDRAIRSGVPASVLVTGEVSNFNHHRGSGHFYFTLKDAEACIDCVMFRSDASRLKFRPEDGHEMIAGGRVGVYPQRGRYQLYVTTLQPAGRGALELAFQQLRAKLEAEGLFAGERKRPLPPYPKRIALVTSRSTAAIQDMLKVFRQYPWLRLYLYDVAVQGEGSAEQIVRALHHLSATAAISTIELIILSRGGGSLEDLWEFNEEMVARAIVASSIPIMTGIGHEVDVSIADMVADYHAHTPTEAARIAVAQWRGVNDRMELSGSRMRRALRAMLQEARQRLLSIERHVIFRRPIDRINTLRQLLDDKQRGMMLALGRRLRVHNARVDRVASRLLECHPRHAVQLGGQRTDSLAARLHSASRGLHDRGAVKLDWIQRQLEALSPARVLKRGYSITTIKKGGVIVRSASQVAPGERIRTRLSEGEIESTVDDANQPRLFE